MRNVLDKINRENQKAFYVQQLFSEDRTLYEIMPKNLVEP
jgi:hypothetical protein